MIYLLTGIPGSGKTLYAVSTLIQNLMKDKFTDDQGLTVDRRLVVDGIKGLAIPHEVLSETVVGDKVKTVTVADGGQGVGNWWEWCKPGDVIVIDEVQRIWRPRAMGASPPQMVTELETHRHKGVDFVIITQSPMLIDQNVRRLVGRHQHIRRLFGMKRALIYDWDGCQSDVHRVAAASKTMWSYPTDAFKLYTSAQLHTKQKQKFPVWVALPILAIVAGAFVAPTAFAKLSGAMTGKGISSPQAAVSQPLAVATVPTIARSVSPVSSAPVSEPVEVVAPDAPVVQEPVIAGCVKSPKGCKCFSTTGDPLEVKADYCAAKFVDKPMPANAPELANVPELNQEVVNQQRAIGDAAVLSWMRETSHKP